MAANDGTTWQKSLANSQVNDKTDTVFGQLARHSDPNSVTNRRIASNATRQGSGRGLGNSSIIQGISTGAVIDAASKNATVDAEIYSNRRTENQRAGTHLEGTAMTNRNNITTTGMNNRNSLDVQGLSNKGALAQIAARGVIDTNIADGRNATDVRTTGMNNTTTLAATDSTNLSNEKRTDSTNLTNEGIAARGNASSETIATGNNNTTRDVTTQTIDGNKDITGMNNESTEGIAADKLASDQLINASSIASNERMNHFDNDTKLEIASLELTHDKIKTSDARYDTAWSELSTGLANIDPNAKAASQTTMANRLFSVYNERKKWIDDDIAGVTDGNDQGGTTWQTSAANGVNASVHDGNGASGIH